MSPPAVSVQSLDFRYAGDPRPPVLAGVSLEVTAGSRTLLVGRNGAGKTTLLHVLAGKHLVPEDKVRVLGRAAFHDTSLAAEVTHLGGRFPFDLDIEVAEILEHQPPHDRARREHLLRVLDVDPAWRMHRVSDGQRRRVQLLLGLLHPAKVLLLDEITTDLDLVARADLLAFLREESERGAALLYATHIMDGLDGWATHLVWMSRGAIRRNAPIDQVPELATLRADGRPNPLLRLVDGWLREG